MAAVNPNGEERYYIDGITFEGVKNPNILIGDDKTIYLNGKTDESLFPLENTDTGKFFLLFE